MNKTIAIFSLSLFAALALGYVVGARITFLRYQNVSVTADRLIESSRLVRAFKGINEGQTEQSKEFLSYQLASQALILDELLAYCPDESSRSHVRRGIAGIAGVLQGVPLQTGYPETQRRLDRILQESLQPDRSSK